MNPKLTLFSLLTVLLVPAFGADAWPQAAGPNGSWMVTAPDVPLHWSVALNQNIVWRTTLPEEGQSGITLWGDRLFLTTMKPLPADAKKKECHEVVGYCLDAATGKILWTVDLPGSVDSTYAYGFSDSTTPSPVTDGQHVWFFNSSGSVGCWDFTGHQIWLREWRPTEKRPFNKQFEPFLSGDALVNMEPRDVGDPKREADPWNYLRGLDKLTGKTLWVADDGLTHYNTPMFGALPDGTPCVLEGRGGHHDVPEAPIGLSLVSLAPGHAGQSIWHFETTGKALYTMQWDHRYAYWFTEEGGEHQVLDVLTGKLLRTQSLTDKVDWRRYDAVKGDYVLQSDINLKLQNPPLGVYPAWFTNIVVDGWHYFLCFTDAATKVGPPHCVGRVNIETGKVEYLELPVSVARQAGAPDRLIWGTAQNSSTVDSRGVDVAGDVRSKRDGWYWCFLGHPTAVNGNIFFTTMQGVTYVIDGHAKVLDRAALLAVNDLGPPSETWSLNSITYANGRLYHRSMKEIVCIGTK